MVKNDPSELFTQAMGMFDSAMKTGANLQEESARWFTNMLNGLGAPQTWQKRTEGAMTEAMTTAQQNVDQALKMVEQNTHIGMDLLQKVFDARQAETGADAQAKTKDLRETAPGAMRTNAEAVLQANKKVVESWSGLAKKLCTTPSNGAT
jgi:thioredoxin-like negative regulator of GroEL